VVCHLKFPQKTLSGHEYMNYSKHILCLKVKKKKKKKEKKKTPELPEIIMGMIKL